MIDRTNGVIYVKIPKTAGTSILETFLQPHGFSITEWDNDVVTNINHVDAIRISDVFRMPGRTKRYNGWHTSARDIQRFLGADFARYRRFASVRHPYDRLVSNYEYQRSKGREVDSFDRFVDALAHHPHQLHRQVQLHAVPQWFWLCNDAGEPLIDRIVRWESIDVDFAQLRSDWRLPSAALPHRNKSDRRRGLQRYFTSRVTCEIVDDLYACDFQHLDYAPNVT